MSKHRYSIDLDTCVCGGQVVYFEDTTPSGEGCEIEGQPWEHIREAWAAREPEED